jgi:Uncharacterized conserved protein (DUF2183)
MSSFFSLFAFAAFGSSDSPIKHDEVVVFFPTFGHQVEGVLAWELLIHGWIHEPEENSLIRRAAIESFRKALGLEKGDEASLIFRQRARAFLVDNKRGKRVSIRLGNVEYPVGRSRPDGHFHGTLRLSHGEVNRLVPEGQGMARHLPFQAVNRPGDNRVFAGTVQLIDPTGVSVISDIDDTIKITEVVDKRAVLANTFLREFHEVPGMTTLYRLWAKEGACFHYVSASPWQLYAPLSGFLGAAGFPSGSLQLCEFRWADTSLFELFASPQKAKRRAIETILAAFPYRRFILVGDSGELDPEIYATLARQHTDQIAHILIRDPGGRGADDERFRGCFAGLPRTIWSVFQQPDDVEKIDVT